MNISVQNSMLSIEIVKIINEMREEGASELAHSDFLKKVVKVLGVEVAGNFSCYYIAENGKKNPCYKLPKRECHLMVMSESYKVQAAVYDKMSELESDQSHKLPANYIEALQALIESEKEKQAALAKIEADRHKLEFAEIVTDNSNTRCVRVWVKAMKHENNLIVGEQRVFKWLLDSGYIFKNGSGGYLPYSKYEANGANYFTVVVDEINGKPRQQLKITGKGVVALTGKVVKAFHTEHDNAHTKPKLSLITHQAAIAKIACLETKIHQRTMVIGGLMTENSRLRAELKSNSLEQSLEPDSISKTGSRE
jgi:phage antirepressor YoqD-like protein